MGQITLIKTISPVRVGKTYAMGKDGKLTKTAIADVYHGEGQVLDVPDAAAMVRLLERVTSSDDLVLVNGTFRDHADKPFSVLTKKRLIEIVTKDGADYREVDKAGTIYTIRTGPQAGARVTARLKVFQEPSGWLLLDADEPEGFPDAWRGLSFQQRLALLEPYAPGLSTAERVELRGSSARVVRRGTNSLQPASHGWVRVDDAADVARASIALRIQTVAGGTSFMSPRYSRETGEVVGWSPRTSIDLAPWHLGRLNFDSMPTVRADGYVVADASITIVNAGGGVFSPKGVETVKKSHTRRYRERTGHEITIRSDGGGAMAVVTGQLTMETAIEANGETRTLAAWMSYMEEHGLSKLRCEAPFRASESEAAFISVRPSDGEPLLYDIGIQTQFRLGAFDDDAFDAFDDPEMPTQDDGDDGPILDDEPEACGGRDDEPEDNDDDDGHETARRSK